MDVKETKTSNIVLNSSEKAILENAARILDEIANIMQDNEAGLISCGGEEDYCLKEDADLFETAETLRDLQLTIRICN